MLRSAETGEPQVITRHGQETAVVLSAEEYDKLVGTRQPKRDLKELLLGGPKVEAFETPRGDLQLRDVDFF